MSENNDSLSGPIKCAVISCSNYLHYSLQENQLFFSFPQDASLAQIWKDKCGITPNRSIQNAKVCSEHFQILDYENEEKTVLKSNIIPTENLGWTIQMPEASKRPNFGEIKEAVDTNEKLTSQLHKLLQEQKSIQEKLNHYQKKINKVEKSIISIKNLSDKNSTGKKCNGKSDSSLICKVFSQAQINMLLGKKKVVWSYDDMAMAFTLRHIGNKECYLYLKDTLNMPLPSLSAVQRWAASNKI